MLWDEMCLVCGGPPSGPHPSEPRPGLEWVDDFIGILETGEVVPLGSYDGSGGFDSADGRPGFYTKYQFDMFVLPEGYEYGLTCHEHCYRLLHRDLGYTLRFQDVWPLLEQEENNFMGINSFTWTSYGGIDKYYDQAFSFKGCYADGNEWMIQDPITHVANAERILEVWRPLLQNGFRIYESGNGNVTVPFKNEFESVTGPNVGPGQAPET